MNRYNNNRLSDLESTVQHTEKADTTTIGCIQPVLTQDRFVEEIIHDVVPAAGALLSGVDDRGEALCQRVHIISQQFNSVQHFQDGLCDADR